MSWQEQITLEEKRRIIAEANAALEKAKRAKAEVNRARIEEREASRK